MPWRCLPSREAAGFIERVRDWARHYALPWPRVALAGFSQGGELALEAVQREPALAGRVLGEATFSGTYTLNARLLASEI